MSIFSGHGEKESSWIQFLNRLIDTSEDKHMWDGASFRTIKDKVKELMKNQAKGDAIHSHLSGRNEEFTHIEQLLTEINQV